MIREREKAIIASGCAISYELYLQRLKALGLAQTLAARPDWLIPMDEHAALYCAPEDLPKLVNWLGDQK
jgi:hypothetical protein